MRRTKRQTPLDCPAALGNNSIRFSWAAGLGLASAMALSACQSPNDPAQVNRALQSVSDVDSTSLDDVMLTMGKPEEAVAYFKQAVASNPGSMAARRGLGKSLMKAGRAAEANAVWTQIIASPEASNEDRVNFAEALIRNNDWARATQVLTQIPPTYETFDRYRLEAMVADSRKDWKKADSFYEIASGMTAQPASVLNNWGFSKLTRGENAGAEKLFMQALTYDSTMFTAKNNLVLSRAAQRKYDLPVIEATQTERAQLYYTAGLAAIKQGDPSVGKQLLQTAIDTHPQYFEAAQRSLTALGG
jgi:Flp pilus assembly protein TadD